MANIFTSALTNNVGTTVTTVYTADTANLTSATIIGMTLANNQGSEVAATVSLERGGITVDLITDVPIPQGSSFVPVGGDQKVVLLLNDVLTVKSSVTNSIDVVVSLLEITST